ncbi:Transcriptional regulator, LysR family [Paraburkholderia tropica]|uniref:LysR family transcriptional regulator n=1 Tax=Paraburkholderia tropica TaxID=92647 RepID=UPI001CAD12AE|nr:LysR family transcriptional regulator [Paraburkholderia tropica]CAG9226941.1 Transcriptional regulator, LysR family [Paraburkholderia tropica]
MAYQRFDGIAEFVLAAQLQSFTAAGLQLGVTSSAIGKSVSRLERRLGIKLLHRTTRRLSLTSEGEIYLGSCLRVMEDLDDTEDSLSTGQPEPRGQLRVTLPGAFGRRHIAPALLALARQYPQLDLTITFGDRTVDMVSEGIDLAVRIGDLKDDAELVARRLGEQYLVICASPDYLRKHGPVDGKAALLEHDCIVGWRRGARSTWLLRGPQGALEEQEIRVRHELGDGEMMVQGVLDGCGLSQLPTWLVHEHLQSGRLVTVLDAFAGGGMPIHVIRPRTRYVQPKVRVVSDALMKLAKKRPDIFLCARD